MSAIAQGLRSINVEVPDELYTDHKMPALHDMVTSEEVLALNESTNSFLAPLEAARGYSTAWRFLKGIRELF